MPSSVCNGARFCDTLRAGIWLFRDYYEQKIYISIDLSLHKNITQKFVSFVQFYGKFKRVLETMAGLL
jgi:hypothetical protein